MEASHVVLPGTNRVPLPGAQALGRASGDEWIEVMIKLRRKAALKLEGRPEAPVSRAELADRYGASAEDIRRVEESLQSYGLEMVESDPARRTVKVAGPVSAIEEAFQVKLIRYAHERGNYRGRVGSIQVPKSLEGIVEDVEGLDNRPVVRRREAAGVKRALSSAAARARSWFFPAELAQIYDFPPGTGKGQTIGILEFGGGYFPSDLAAFCKAAGVGTPTVVPVSVDNASTTARDGAEGEVMLDIEVVAGVCPEARIAVYFSTFSQKGWIDAIDTAVHDSQNEPTVLSISWGDAEDHASWTAQGIQQVNESLKEAAMLGMTVCVASGDDGSDDQVGDGHAHVDFPASSPYVLAVGGTTLRRHAGKYTETAWKNGDGLRKDHGGASGGGVSVVFDRPSWQVVNIDSVNPGAKPGRCVPDVAADADAHTGYFMVVDGQSGPNGGTSASAPLWAALIARVNSALPSGKRAGYVTPLLYGPAGSNGKPLGALVCKDINTGNNTSAAVGGYHAGPGYDAVTGWGSPVGSALLTHVAALV